MTTYRAPFTWPLPPTRETIARYVAVLSTSVGYPCRSDLLHEAEDHVTAALSFPRISKNNLVTLSSQRGELDFAVIPFFWAHATHSVIELGGAFPKPVLCERPDWTARRWHELRWTERAKILLGLGSRLL